MAKKSQKKSELVKFVSPFGTARFPKLNEPDTDGQYADNKFKTDIVFADADVEKVRAQLVAAAEQLLSDVPVEDRQLPLKEFFRKKGDDKKGESEGWGIRTKSTRRPALFDAKKQKLPNGVIVGGGSEIRVAGVLARYESTDKQTVIENGKKRTETVTVYGITLYLNEVQVRKLVVNTAGTGADFDEVEGGFEYTNEGESESAFGGSGDDATDL
jgi:hypothetical protein